MTQSADADNTDSLCRFDAEMQQRIKDGDTAAEQWSHGAALERIGNRNRPHPMHAHAVGKGAVASNDGSSGGDAKMLIAIQARMAMHAAR